ncbi:hypothetical protein SODALDRAFT_164484 [Sodiomyces alkalinus F11]|uniref:Uncharacterized protein n=1 Tax=Sodiomyces alkalinus (strain CBS 110278 / VKM F-3762 / F11) TaxID=1314773 RepID=A0A3N2PVL1_SODAK|nr:hypothetical protein SODALDRAFT_164484 [Sodiomyces alkalinus F11]ROT38537.1 hypothetical protein SODALDRAFT_164484 [Sodiomyces alkalinus F11]
MRKIFNSHTRRRQTHDMILWVVDLHVRNRGSRVAARLHDHVRLGIKDIAVVQVHMESGSFPQGLFSSVLILPFSFFFLPPIFSPSENEHTHTRVDMFIILFLFTVPYRGPFFLLLLFSLALSLSLLIFFFFFFFSFRLPVCSNMKGPGPDVFGLFARSVGASGTGGTGGNIMGDYSGQTIRRVGGCYKKVQRLETQTRTGKTTSVLYSAERLERHRVHNSWSDFKGVWMGKGGGGVSLCFCLFTIVLEGFQGSSGFNVSRSVQLQWHSVLRLETRCSVS